MTRKFNCYSSLFANEVITDKKVMGTYLSLGGENVTRLQKVTGSGITSENPVSRNIAGNSIKLWAQISYDVIKPEVTS